MSLLRHRIPISMRNARRNDSNFSEDSDHSIGNAVKQLKISSLVSVKHRLYGVSCLREAQRLIRVFITELSDS